MLISVGDVRLFVDVVGSCLANVGGAVVEQPTILLLHGGPGFDHMSLRPDYERLSDVAQLILFDHRGNGRSDRSCPEHWTLAQWSRDVAGLIDALGLQRPIVFGQSFGGIVAQKFASDYPGRYAGLILSSTLANFDLEAVIANFEALHGRELAELARRYFSDRTDAIADEYSKRCYPLYSVSNVPIGAASIRYRDVAAHFFSRGGEGLHFDLRKQLHKIDAPTLLIGGDRDPVVPAAAMQEMVRYFAPGIAEHVVFRDCGHGPARDWPQQTLAMIRRFINRMSGANPRGGER